jgi:hypothetical protein
MRWEDRSLVSERQVPRLKLEYQLSRPIFIRLVGEYDAQRRDDLRDDNTTDLPILIRQSDGSYARAAAFERGRFRGDFLFSFQPSPGTVFFAGYGSTLAAEDRAGLNDLRRTSDGFFLKFSYLFRM